MPIKYKGVKPDSVGDDEWEIMDENAKTTILLIISKKIYYNVETESSTFSIWQKLDALFEQQSAASKVFRLKKLMNLWMKEGAALSLHLNKFHSTFSQLINQKVNFDDEGTAKEEEDLVANHVLGRMWNG